MKPPRPISLAGKESGVAPPPSHGTQSHIPKPLGLPTQAVSKPHGPARSIGLASGSDQHDALVDIIVAHDQSLAPLRMRIKPRIATLSKATDDDLLNWGDRNLVALRSVTQDQAKLAARLAQINPTDWMDRCVAASCRPPSVMAKLFGSVESPAYYQTKIEQIRAELMLVIKDLRVLHEEISPDVEDLRMDIVALQGMVTHHADRFDATISDNRLRTLISGQQTVVMAVQAIDAMRKACAQYIQTIDNVLQVTIPNWLIANSRH